MKKHTKKAFKEVWDREDKAKSRAKREGSSAPLPTELEIYENYLKRAIGQRKNPKVLILGATPELRDLCLEHNWTVLAVDVSLKIISAMNQVMVYHKSEKDLIMCCDWLAMDRYLKENNFDVILADVCLNNIAVEDQPNLLKILKKLLKPGGYLITRNAVFLPERKVRNISEIVNEYKKRGNNWLGLLLEIGYYSPWANKVYHSSNKRFNFSKLGQLIKKSLKDKIISLSRKDEKKIENMLKHGAEITHITFSKKDFESLLRKYFWIIEVEASEKYIFCQYVPIYLLKKKQYEK